MTHWLRFIVLVAVIAFFATAFVASIFGWWQ